MLHSSSTTNLQAAQGLHRRQQSTPTAFFDVKAAAAAASTSAHPNALNRYSQAPGHRRGMSLDVRRRQHQQQPMQIAARHEYNNRMGINGDLLAATSQHHALQEAQQQTLQPRPGPGPLQSIYDTYQVSPQEGPSAYASSFDAAGSFVPDAMQFNSFGAPMSIAIPKNQGAYINDSMPSSGNFDFFATDSAQSTPTFVNFPESPMGSGWASEGEIDASKRLRRFNHGVEDRASKGYENMGMEDIPRPVTPTTVNENDYLLPTPLGTPHGQAPKQEAHANRFLDNYDESMVETIKPNRKRQTQTAQDIFSDIQPPQAGQDISAAGASGPTSVPVPNNQVFPGGHMQIPDYMSVMKDAFQRMETRYDGIPGGPAMLQSSANFAQQMPLSVNPAGHGQMEQMMGGPFEDPSQAQQLLHSDDLSDTDSLSRPSRHRRTESMASIASAASIANINIDETRTETGVTLEEIAQFIQSPDTTDGKWTCLFEGCGKQFGRKENIKSHVQTHLNDRQYQCPTCQKCFVRQHDLKRHAKIHTGIKPYPCDCGNSFARHDALTRHRQRGMCIGAFDGIVRKVVKRGRPKKNRPDMDTRLEKSTKTRRKNASISSISSQSGYSDFDSSSVMDSSDFDQEMPDDELELSFEAKTQELSSLSSAPMPGVASRPPMEYAPSPAVSSHSLAAADAVLDKVPQLESPETGGRSQDNTPPGLSQSSSPPPRLFDLDHGAGPTPEGLAHMTAAGMMMSSATINGALPMDNDDQSDQMLAQYSAGESGLMPLHRDPMMMMNSKYDEEDYDSTVGMFTNNDDAFFSSL